MLFTFFAPPDYISADTVGYWIFERDMPSHCFHPSYYQVRAMMLGFSLLAQFYPKPTKGCPLLWRQRAGFVR